MKTLLKTTLTLAALGLASATLSDTGAAQAAAFKLQPEVQVLTEDCGPAPCGLVRAGFLDDLGRGIVDVGKGIGKGASEVGKGVGKGVGQGVDKVFGGGKKDKVRKAARKEAKKIKSVARDIRHALPTGAEARKLARAIRDKDGRAVQALLRTNSGLRNSLKGLKRMGFNTITVGVESSGSYFVGGAHETGFTMDIDFDRTPRIYTTTSLSGGYHFGGGNDLAFSFFKSGHNRIGGHAFGSIAEFDVGTGAGVNMWFSAKPFDFAGFSLGVGIGSVGGGGAVTYALTKVWN